MHAFYSTQLGAVTVGLLLGGTGKFPERQLCHSSGPISGLASVPPSSLPMQLTSG